MLFWPMKPITALLASIGLIVVPACEKKPETVGEKVKEGVNDALDRRPAEGVKDAAEDVKDAVQDAAGEVKDAAKEATE